MATTDTIGPTVDEARGFGCIRGYVDDEIRLIKMSGNLGKKAPPTTMRKAVLKSESHRPPQSERKDPQRCIVHIEVVGS